MRSTNPCGYAHPKNRPCRLCDQIRRQEAAAEEFASEVLEPVREAVKSALTAAEKQKAYRKRILADSERAEEYRRKNRERMRRVRGK